jgi:hypothetical protein
MPPGPEGFNSEGLNILTYLKIEYSNSEELWEKNLSKRICEGCEKVQFLSEKDSSGFSQSICQEKLSIIKITYLCMHSDIHIPVELCLYHLSPYLLLVSISIHPCIQTQGGEIIPLKLGN